MPSYKLTAFEPNGEKIIDETFDAVDDHEAKTKGAALIEEQGLQEKTHRCTSPTGKLLLFHP
ncbi:YhzD family protein [Bacillus chungangensis]|uniref:YhzD-like protein n=1 Tax=Bacillus chungangensis TaxID=587633 RepID=A0ABT9WNF6_9BACI|nr:YhzD family protein [Bacillus chungangensis]MDQ0174801.1 hypothetical protein [Bacillus chungangensis]